MSRHRRQASQVLPPELVYGADDPPAATTLSHAGAGVSGQATTGATRTHNNSTDPPTTAQPAPATHFPAPGSKPPAGRASGV
ncbi:hypothetical protein PVL29_007982 [Vitis rotundifolia]|uniref:Uncharacterized protein n=1 Tax=Vitis rotundifolia TaxID=103349 RepID=A0AA39DZ34_VITRO|nr:hypothetical protein PVL29_007982 [Vitis rotundifolia]